MALVKIVNGYEICDQAARTALDGKVPSTRTINGKELSEDITLTPEDLGIAASGFPNYNEGSPIQGVYFEEGVPVEVDHTVEKSVPSNAMFSDTQYELVDDGNGNVTLVPTTYGSVSPESIASLELPVASKTKLGAVIVGDGLTINKAGVLSATAQSGGNTGGSIEEIVISETEPTSDSAKIWIQI